MQITHKTVPWMPVGRKMQNIVFFLQKSALISNGDYCVKNLPYQRGWTGGGGGTGVESAESGVEGAESG